jgi:hypothetical protein
MCVHVAPGSYLSVSLLSTSLSLYLSIYTHLVFFCSPLCFLLKNEFSTPGVFSFVLFFSYLACRQLRLGMPVLRSAALEALKEWGFQGVGSSRPPAIRFLPTPSALRVHRLGAASATALCRLYRAAPSTQRPLRTASYVRWVCPPRRRCCWRRCRLPSRAAHNQLPIAPFDSPSRYTQ